MSGVSGTKDIICIPLELMFGWLRNQRKDTTLDLIHMFLLPFKNFFNWYGKALFLHLLKFNSCFLVILLKLLWVDTRPLLNYPLHNFVIFSVNPLCLLPFHDIIKGFGSCQIHRALLLLYWALSWYYLFKNLHSCLWIFLRVFQGAPDCFLLSL